MKKLSTRQLLNIKRACLEVISKGTGAVELAQEQLNKVNKELEKRGN